MEGSANRIRTLTRKLASGLVLAGVVALAGCGGGGDSNSANPAAPVSQAPKSAGGLVSADATQGLVGPASRSTDKNELFSDRTADIPAKAKGKTNAQKHGVAGGAACADSGITPDDSNLAQVNAAVLCLVNAERADQGLPALAANAQLDKAAQGMSQRMAAEKFFSHETPDGKTVVDRVEPTGYIPNNGDWVVGENLAWGSGALATPQAIVNGWMNSPGHKANILAPDYKDIGVAAINGSPAADREGGTIYVHVFGAKEGADANATLPGHDDPGAAGSDDGGGDSGSPAATVAGTKAAAAAKKAKARKARAKKARAKKKSKKKKRKKRRSRR